MIAIDSRSSCSPSLSVSHPPWWLAEMKAATAPSWCTQHHPSPLSNFSPFSRQTSFLLPRFAHTSGLGLYRNGLQLLQSTCVVTHAVSRSKDEYASPWDDEPFYILPGGRKAYLDEQDVVTFLDPPKELIPLDPTSYNPAAYLWKKIGDIPEERRHRLLLLLEPRLISRAWQIAGTRYEDSKLVKKSASTLMSNEDDVMLEYYNCRTSGGPMPISWINVFRKAIFSCKNGNSYGRFIGGSVLTAFANSFTPLYFTVRQLKEVMSNEQPCDLAYEFGDGLYDIQQLPQGFPRPVKHPYPFNDQVVIYVRHLGPGVSVGQAWQEGKKLEQVPRKLCSEILMVKDYASLRQDQ